MSTVAEIEALLRTMSVEELAALERFVHETRENKLRGFGKASTSSFAIRTHDFGFRPDLDLTKLGQLANEL